MSTSTVPMFSPDGLLTDIPYENMHAARKSGGIPAVQMKSPDGEDTWIPANRMQDAVKSGGQIVPIESQEAQHPGFWHAVAEDSLGLATGLLGGPLAMTIRGLQQAGAERESIAATGKTTEMLQNEQQKAAGYGPAYRYLASPAAGAVGVNVPAMEQSAKEGDVGGVLGRTVVPAASAVAPSVAARGLSAAHEVLPSTTRSGAGIGVLEHTFAEHPIDATPAYQVTRKIGSELATTGSEKDMHPLIEGYQRNVEARDLARNHPEEYAAAQEAVAKKAAKRGAAPPQGELGDPNTFGGARAYLRKANQIINYEHPSVEHTRQLQRFAGTLSDSIDQGVAKPSPVAPDGFAQDYQAMKGEYRSGSAAIRKGEAIGEPLGTVIGGGLGAYAGRGMADVADVGMTGIGAAAGRFIGKKMLKPVIGGMVRGVIERPGTPQLKSLEPPRPPGSYNQTLAQYTRDMLDAKEGKISPTYLNQLIKKSPKLRPIPRRPDEE